MGFLEKSFKNMEKLGIVMQTCNLSTWEAEASSRPAWDIYQDLIHIYIKIFLQNKQTKQNPGVFMDLSH